MLDYVRRSKTLGANSSGWLEVAPGMGQGEWVACGDLETDQSEGRLVSELAIQRKKLSELGRALGDEAGDHATFLQHHGQIVDEEGLTASVCSQLVMASRKSNLMPTHSMDVAITNKITEEPICGADMLIAFVSQLSKWRLQTRTLIQAKKAEPEKRMSSREWDRMKAQIADMQRVSEENFLLVFSKQQGVCVFPAMSVAACDSREIFDLDWYRLAGFIEGIFCGFIGQPTSGLYPDGYWARNEVEIIVNADKHRASPTHTAEGRGPSEGGLARDVQGDSQDSEEDTQEDSAAEQRRASAFRGSAQ